MYMKVTLFLFVALFADVAMGAGKYYCKIGADPVNPHRQVGPDEKVVALAEDVHAPLSSKSGHVCHGWLHAGEKVVVSKATGKLLWVKRCGNDVLSDVYLASPPARDEPVPSEGKLANTTSSTVTPISFNFEVNPEVMKPYKDCVGSCADANEIARVAVGVVGDAAIGYGIFRSGHTTTKTHDTGGGGNGNPHDPPNGPGTGSPHDPPNGPYDPPN